jgi:hypothetical protein
MMNDADARRQTPGLPTPMSAAHLYVCLGVGSAVTHQVQDQAVSDGRSKNVRTSVDWRTGGGQHGRCGIGPMPVYHCNEKKMASINFYSTNTNST